MSECVPKQSPIDAAVLALLRCPRTGNPLRAGIREGRPVLMTDDGRAVYAIRNGIPILLPDQPAADTLTIKPSTT